MARRRGGERVLGPYEERNGQWRIVVVGVGGDRVGRFFATEREAKTARRLAERKLAEVASFSLKEAIEAYEMHLREEKKNKPGSVRDTVYRLRAFFPVDDELVAGLTPAKCQRLYDELRVRPTKTGRPFADDSALNILAEAKTFGAWCVSKKWLASNPLAEVRGVGSRRHGKPQLRIDEARRWMEVAHSLAAKGEGGAVAAMLTLVLGMRSTETVSRVVRDVDDGGRLLWIPASKTPAGRRTLEVPAFLQEHLLRLTEGKASTDLLFGQHWRDWPRHWVKRICRLAKVPEVTAHGMRGLHSTLAVESGVTPHAVAASLGHESIKTTYRSYARPEAVVKARQRRVVTALAEAKATS